MSPPEYCADHQQNAQPTSVLPEAKAPSSDAVSINIHAKARQRDLIDQAAGRLNVARDAGVFATLLHAISYQARQLYPSRALCRSTLQPMTQLMTIKTMRSALSEPD